jgi:hypothetical protein
LLFLYSVQALWYLCDTDVVTKHSTYLKKNPNELICPTVRDLREKACPLKTEQLVRTGISVDHFKFYRPKNDETPHHQVFLLQSKIASLSPIK